MAGFTALLKLSGKALAAGGSLYSGISAYGIAQNSASLLEQQGVLARDDYTRQAVLIRDEGFRTRAKQTMQYISAGVEIAGTPQLVLKETLLLANARATSYDVTGRNLEGLYRQKAAITREEGRAELVGGILNAGASLI